MRKFEVVASYQGKEKKFIIESQGPASAKETALKRFKSQNKIKISDDRISISIKQINDD